MLSCDTAAFVGLVDSGTCPSVPTIASRSFRTGGPNVTEGVATEDALGHSTEMIRLIRAAAPQATLAVAQVFDELLFATPHCVAEAIDWLVGLGVDIVNLSLGTTQDSLSLRECCRRTRDAGCILVASAPARGPAVFPAAYPDVVRVTGDARCRGRQFSWVGTNRIDFGACPYGLDERTRNSGLGGASMAAARVTGELGALIASGVPTGKVVAVLAATCKIVGPQTAPVRNPL